MELENLEISWKEYDRKLAENLKVNKELVRQMTLGKIRKETGSLQAYILINLICGILFLVLLFGWTLQLRYQPIYLGIGLFAVVYFVVYMLIGGYEYVALSRLQRPFEPVAGLQSKLISFEQKILMIKRYELITLPFCFAATLLLVLKCLANTDIREIGLGLLFVSAAALALCYLVIFLIYKYFYDEKIANMRSSLEHLRQFTEE